MTPESKDYFARFVKGDPEAPGVDCLTPSDVRALRRIVQDLVGILEEQNESIQTLNNQIRCNDMLIRVQKLEKAVPSRRFLMACIFGVMLVSLSSLAISLIIAL